MFRNLLGVEKGALNGTDASTLISKPDLFGNEIPVTPEPLEEELTVYENTFIDRLSRLKYLRRFDDPDDLGRRSVNTRAAPDALILNEGKEELSLMYQIAIATL